MPPPTPWPALPPAPPAPPSARLPVMLVSSTVAVAFSVAGGFGTKPSIMRPPPQPAPPLNPDPPAPPWARLPMSVLPLTMREDVSGWKWSGSQRRKLLIPTTMPPPQPAPPLAPALPSLPMAWLPMSVLLVMVAVALNDSPMPPPKPRPVGTLAHDPPGPAMAWLPMSVLLVMVAVEENEFSMPPPTPDVPPRPTASAPPWARLLVNVLPLTMNESWSGLPLAMFAMPPPLPAPVSGLSVVGWLWAPPMAWLPLSVLFLTVSVPPLPFRIPPPRPWLSVVSPFPPGPPI